ncbi:nitrogenase molybdenum-iron protein subunit alpha (plasmid) [Nostoc sp. HK-01]|nr:nitrogenase molybdenum-iron protein subunit alpha [Nostoc sp. HK-01]
MPNYITEQQTDIAQQREQLIEEILTVYPDKSRQKREQQINVYKQEKSDCGVKSNIKGSNAIF